MELASYSPLRRASPSVVFTSTRITGRLPAIGSGKTVSNCLGPTITGKINCRVTLRRSTALLNGLRSKKFRSFRCLSALTPELRTTLDKVVASQKVLLFMKGTAEFPQCGFSSTVVQMLKSLNVPFETIDVLENEILRQGLKEYSNWPTFPQLYIDGEFFGGCDITVEAYKSGQLQELLEKALCS
ncbi:monothiol glutaredoxin-S7, chloroplastic [Coffea eugenioides]|uniref:Glutaredoxin domain-containing protein n=1 Tax=Coffea arabica TaxID=13443 RepID=A0A6P6VHD4_COFAR|nr:monothiol glutaredoxin-S7, chloroplastic [Coffea arabica]XP_027153739.1 monothiol glutaredoxin-S7, chloroplastic [Coffea eugenioides]